MTFVLLFHLACGGPTSPSAPPPPEPVAVPEPPPPPPAPVVEPLPTSGPFHRELAPGLTVAAYDAPDIPDVGYSRVPPGKVHSDTRLFVVTVDPAHYSFRYLSILDEAVEPGTKTADAWADAFDLHVVFNPGMFEPGYEPTGYTRTGDLVPQQRVRAHRLYRGWFVAGETVSVVDQVPPKATSGKYSDYDAVPEVVRARLDAADVVSQSLPILLGGEPAYPPRTKHWSELAYGADDQGRMVVVFSRHPYEMRELGARVAALDLGIDGLIHGEGGPEASLVVRAGGVELVKVGSYETGFFSDNNRRLWQLPAVIGAVPR